MSLKKQAEIEQLNKLYTGQNKDEYIYRDRRDSKVLKFFKIIFAFAVSVLPTIGPIIQALMKFTV